MILSLTLVTIIELSRWVFFVGGKILLRAFEHPQAQTQDEDKVPIRFHEAQAFAFLGFFILHL